MTTWRSVIAWFSIRKPIDPRAGVPSRGTETAGLRHHAPAQGVENPIHRRPTGTRSLTVRAPKPLPRPRSTPCKAWRFICPRRPARSGPTRADRAARVMSLVRLTRGGKEYDADWAQRMKGTGPVADLISARFKAAVKRYGLEAPRHQTWRDEIPRPSVGAHTVGPVRRAAPQLSFKRSFARFTVAS